MAVERINASLTAHAMKPTEETAVEVKAAFADYAVALGSADTKMVAGLLVTVFGRLDNISNIFQEFVSRLDSRFVSYETQAGKIAEALRALDERDTERWNDVSIRLNRKRAELDDHELRIQRIEKHLGLDNAK